MKDMFFGAGTVLLIVISVLIWSVISGYENDKYIKIKSEALASIQTKAISKFCEEDNFFQSSKYKCYLEGLTMYKNSSNKESIIQNYNTKYNEAIKSNKDFQQNQFPWILSFLVVFIAILIPIIMKKSREH